MHVLYRYMIAATAAGAGLWPAAAAPVAGQAAVLNDTARAVHLLQRATYGPRPADVEQVLRIGRAAWLERQLQPDRIPDAAMDQRLARYPAATMSPADLMAQYPPPQLVRRQQQRMASDSASKRPRRRPGPAGPARIAGDLVGAKLARAVHSERQLEEVMTDFWFNHFNVFFNKNADRYLVGAYEREAIRLHVFGRFEDMLVATARHPAMLVYLDNVMSVATPRPSGRGLNENYARELLELHTLGVDAGYTQQDVVDVARAFTGWSITRPRGPGAARARMMDDTEIGRIEFAFRPVLHDRGEKLVLGHRLPAGRGIEDGMDVLRIVARHPATARHIAAKLVERFVGDDPPRALVDELAAVFTRTGGDLREVTRALFSAESFYDPAHYRTKVKRPFELVASALRATGAEVGPSRAIVQALRSFGHLPYMQSAPTGYPAASEDWVNSGALLARMNFGLALAAGRLDGVRIDRAALLDGGTTGDVVGRLAGRLLPGADTGRLERLVLEDLARGVAVSNDAAGAPARSGREPHRPASLAAAPTDPRARALGLFLGSPEFQRH